MKYGIVIVSHSPKIAEGIKDLISQAAPHLSITYAGGTDEGEIGSSLEKIQSAFDENTGDEILAFYDLGSSKMNLEMYLEMTDKIVHKYDVAIVEGAYTAATLAEIDSPLETIENSLKPLKIK
ncbi:dihydroxyacetone kinase phosphoryl donor subunit DhaM [Companilactobacillus sp.]|jgi:dihydroxyacetone kinase phosphotransfer subunit|uniref:dihydroxyacetone kinase phosphoryl donor subunit DhaM n=1 Tax=Companilactobacillus sp. TaxID=2767905 RepID=UPI0025B9AC34|nr:dihydroxyacetone kinase phosphoryl donor subunit DhaM [Companilactobacillus sp.]MCH4008360.1 PTS-dependent dihydroxyacetone kinase phosphotransferase subunit DhaM [Companilactobacillus sp.]MCH4051461.1 PTS-dependent dihydroxyacetone kinase phosphotransferase subunit DhaM [Companilactobacillus sp.]MCH4076303.1 PTS-dependent dihydroxyacetone kinase phosphotransferase subunit DhaM [Companilactobacillus sp.]MCH4124878.1 PTS-dependent dihydroxyacetone kinase phosphotransferase subunit DhaM [Compa